MNKFDLVSDDSDHKYRVENTAGDCFSNTKSAVYKRIMKEWKILEKSLPDSIYVRAYEHRIDLLRAVIAGTPGTPYHDGLFFFDITRSLIITHLMLCSVKRSHVLTMKMLSFSLATVSITSLRILLRISRNSSRNTFANEGMFFLPLAESTRMGV